MEAADTRNFAAQWRDYRGRRTLAISLLYTLVPASAVVIAFAAAKPHLTVYTLPVIPVWIVATWGAIWWAGEFRCPRCCRRFGAIGSKGATGSWSRGLFDDICHNCRVRKFTETE